MVVGKQSAKPEGSTISYPKCFRGDFLNRGFPLELPKLVKMPALGGEWGCLNFLWKRQKATDSGASLGSANPTGTLTHTVGVLLWNGEDSTQPDRSARLSTQKGINSKNYRRFCPCQSGLLSITALS